MGGKSTSGRPTRRRYPPEEKARAARLVRRAQGARHDARDGPAGGPTRPAAGVEPLRARVEQADTDKGIEPGPRTTEAKRTTEPEQENHGLRRANDPLKRAPALSAAEPDRPRKTHQGHPQTPAGASEQPPRREETADRHRPARPGTRPRRRPRSPCGPRTGRPTEPTKGMTSPSEPRTAASALMTCRPHPARRRSAACPGGRARGSPDREAYS